jgi:hypothetical protein
MAMRKGLGEINNKTTALLHNVFVAENQLRCTSKFFHDLQNQVVQIDEKIFWCYLSLPHSAYKSSCRAYIITTSTKTKSVQWK